MTNGRVDLVLVKAQEVPEAILLDAKKILDRSSYGWNNNSTRSATSVFAELVYC